MLQGSSYAGLFTLYALFADPGLFSGYMAASPAVPFGDRYVFKQEAEYVEPGNPICRHLAGHETRGGAAAHILAGPLPEIAIQRIHAARELRTIMARPELLYEE